MRLTGRPRALTDDQLSTVRRWKSLAELAREWNLNVRTVQRARTTHFKSERSRKRL